MTMGNSDDENGEICLTENSIVFLRMTMPVEAEGVSEEDTVRGAGAYATIR